MKQEIPDIKLGHVLLTLLEPKAGFERKFHRWYERDHFYAGCMIGANFFSGRRWPPTHTLIRFSGTVLYEDSVVCTTMP
ncbi:Uncharacterised protein [Halioglobus japonicus]|nr:Uncharacterised protein [Halioglobus japonicus]